MCKIVASGSWQAYKSHYRKFNQKEINIYIYSYLLEMVNYYVDVFLLYTRHIMEGSCSYYKVML